MGTHVEIEEPENALVREDVEDVAGVEVDDGQAVNTVLDQQLDGLVQTRVGVDRHQAAAVLLQNICRQQHVTCRRARLLCTHTRQTHFFTDYITAARDKHVHFYNCLTADKCYSDLHVF